MVSGSPVSRYRAVSTLHGSLDGATLTQISFAGTARRQCVFGAGRITCWNRQCESDGIDLSLYRLNVSVYTADRRDIILISNNHREDLTTVKSQSV